VIVCVCVFVCVCSDSTLKGSVTQWTTRTIGYRDSAARWLSRPPHAPRRVSLSHPLSRSLTCTHTLSPSPFSLLSSRFSLSRVVSLSLSLRHSLFIFPRLDLSPFLALSLVRACVLSLSLSFSRCLSLSHSLVPLSSFRAHPITPNPIIR